MMLPPVHHWLLPLSQRAQSVAVGLMDEAIGLGHNEPEVVRLWAVDQCTRRLFGASSEQGRLYIDVRLRLLEYPDSARRLIGECAAWAAKSDKERAALCEMSRAVFQAQQLERFKAQREEWATKAQRRAR